MSLSLHQKKVLGALLALEIRFEWRWFDRDALGAVVMAGGYHSVIQQRTIDGLIEQGLVQSQASSWSPETVAEVRCGCAAHKFGLTEAGRVAAGEIRFRVTEEMRARLEHCAYHATNWTERALARERDEDEDE